MAYYENAEDSAAEMRRLVDAMASGGRISAADAALGRADIEAALAAADDAAILGYDARTFWTSLAGAVNANRAAYAAWGGGARTAGKRSAGESYAASVLSGLQAYDSAAATAYASSWSALWTDVVVESAADYATVAEKAASTVSNPWYLWGVAAIVLGVVVLKVKGGR